MKFFWLVAFSFIFSGLSAQRVCETAQYAEMRKNTSVRSNVGGTLNRSARDTNSNEIITIPVVIHILFNNNEQNISDEQIISQIVSLNKDFSRRNADAQNTPEAFRSLAADTKISFCLAQVDPQGRPSKGIIRKFTNVGYFLGDDGMKFTASGGNDAWDTRKYLNIWVCNMFGRSLGYATMPGSDITKDGVVINFDVFGTVGNLRSNFDKGRTATHEVGHWLGLKHIWGDDNCGSDDVDDTPRQLSYNYNCPSFPHVTSCSINGAGDMFMNYMDLTNDACMNMFTYGQKAKMRSLFALNGLKNSFLDSFACDSTLATGAPLPNDTLPLAQPVSSIKVFPNPARDIITVTPVNNYQLKGKPFVIFNMAGGVLIQSSFANNTSAIDLSRLPAGMYIMKVGSGSEKRMVKIIKI